MTHRRGFGLQGWLVGALLAVGMAASLAVLLVVLPTLESSVRSDRAKREGSDLVEELRVTVRDPTVTLLAAQSQLQGLADTVGTRLRVEVVVTLNPGFGQIGRIARYPDDESTVSELSAVAPVGRFIVVNGGTGVATAASFDGGRGPGSGKLTVVRRVSGLAPELAIVRRRVLVAMVVVLGLAALAGIAIARVLGGRIRRLASTAASLAGGDLSARYPRGRVAPEEIVTLGESLNGMAARLQSLVAEITRERDRDRAMIGSLAEGVLAVSPDGTVAVANDAANRFLGLPEGAESARLDALPPAILDAVLTARGQRVEPAETRLVVLPDGTELAVHVAPLADDHRAGTVVTLRDVTEQRRLDRARRDLVANVSHELKTPIAALKGFLELLEGDGVDERHRREFLASMTHETGRLERLVEEQLQLARLDAGAVPLEREEIDLGDLASVVVAPRIPLAEREGITLSARPDPSGPVVVEVDPPRIEQILLILLDNALRHTPRGGRVQVVVGRDGQDATLAVVDSGEGIPTEDQAFVFDRFYRGDPSREGRSAGLGLAIARGLAAAHRGSISLESRVGEGSTFTVRLPLAVAGPVTEESPILDLARLPAPGSAAG